MYSKLPQVGQSIFAQMTALANQYQAINLAQGFPNFNPPDALIEFFYEALKSGMNQYAPMPGYLPLREQIANRMYTRYNKTVDPQSEITITTGATQAIYSIISACISPGDKALILEPAYDSYGPSVLVNSGIPIYVRMDEPSFDIPWKKIKDAIQQNDIKVMILNNPHNPTGRIWTREDYMKLIEITKDKKILFIFDEVYDALVYEGKKHISALEFPEFWENSFVCFSFGKTFHTTGWKIAYTIAPIDLTNELRKLHQFTVFSVNTPGQYANAKFMEYDPDFINGLSAFYQMKRNFFLEGLKETNFSALPCEGSYFVLAQHENCVNDEAFCHHLVKDKKVAAVPISAFYHDRYDPKIIRFCFAKTDDLLESALTLLKER